MKPAATIAAFKFSVSGVGGGTEELEEGGHYDPHCCRHARRHWRGDDANHTARTTKAPRGPTQSTAVRSTLKQHPPHPETGPGDAHEMRLKEPTPPAYFCARMRRPLRFRNRTPSATSRRSSRRGLRRETEQSAGRTSEGVTLNAAYRRPIGANFRQGASRRCTPNISYLPLAPVADGG